MHQHQHQHHSIGRRLRLAIASLFLFGTSTATPAVAERNDSDPVTLPLIARIVATGIPGVSAVSSVGTFLAGGPIHDLDTTAQPFNRTTRPGEILDPRRIVVASTSNFGLPLARTDEQPGAVLSIDPNGTGPLTISSTFAHGGGQASASSGRVRLFTAQSPAFSNQKNNPTASTASETAVSNPLGISINNAFGRLWFANAPTGPTGNGTSTVIDPTGMPLLGAPSQTAGGVFYGARTDRPAASGTSGNPATRGLRTGAVGTAMLGPSPDGTANAVGTPRVVFATVTADGAVQQVHVQKGVDDLAPPGTISPLRGRIEDGTPARVGVAWDGMCLFITDPVANRIAVLMLSTDPISSTAKFHIQSVGHIPVAAGVLSTPIDIAPTQPETQSKKIASNTSLASGSDLYVANWGNNTIVRLNEEGRVLGVRKVILGLEGLSADAWHLNGIGVSSDGTRIWATIAVGSSQVGQHSDGQGRNGHSVQEDSASASGSDGGIVIELPAF